MTITEKVAYLKGLAEGLGLDTEKSKEAKLISVMVGILEEIGLSLEDLEQNSLDLGEEIDALSDDLAELEAVFVDDEDGCGCGHDHSHGDVLHVLDCPNCGADIGIDEEALETGDVFCYECNGHFSLDISEEDEEEIQED